jgi:hypothetical protein
VKAYEPTDEDLFIRIPSGDYQRMIWSEPLPLNDREKEYDDKFKDFVKENNLKPLPDFYTSSERIALRYLQGCYWDY